MSLHVKARAARLVLAAAALGAITGCGKMMRGRDDAVRAVAEFHERFNAGQFDAIYDTSSDELKGASTRENLSALLGAVRRKLGDVTGSATRTWNLRTANLTTYVTLIQDTSYSNGRATESFGFVVRDGRAILVNYNVSSNDLILR